MSDLTLGLPVRAPRGKQFAIQQQTHVASSPLHPVRDVLNIGRFDDLELAARSANAIDWRLNPRIVIVDREQRT